MAPSNVKLVYFNGRGRAEQLRWMLVQAGAKWEDKRVEFADWPALKADTPVGSLPYMEAEGKQIGTSGAVAMYIAKEYGLLGCNDLEAALIHMIWECTQDSFNAYVKCLFCEDEAKKAEMTKEYFSETLPKLVKLMDGRLSGGKCWLVGDKVSMADIVTASLLENCKEGPGLDLLNQHSNVKALVNRVYELPNIKKWIANRPSTDL